MAKNIWVLAEHEDGEWQEVTLELLGEARRLASRCSGEVVALLLGHNIASLAPSLGQWGADTVYVVEDPLLEAGTTEVYAIVLEGLIKRGEPEVLLMGSTFAGSELGPRLATRLGAGLVTECVDLKIGPDGLLEMTRPLQRGSLYSRWVCPKARPQIATVRPGVIGKGRPNQGRNAEIVAISPDLDVKRLRTRITGAVKADPATMDVAEAESLIVCGRGIGSAEKLGVVGELAELLGAALGASRPVVDNGWLPYERQIGQTARTVSPRLLVSCGVSGASQHTMGMKDSKFIIAVNTDQAAPIFKLADIAIVADMHQFLPLLVQKLRETIGKTPEMGEGR